MNKHDALLARHGLGERREDLPGQTRMSFADGRVGLRAVKLGNALAALVAKTTPTLEALEVVGGSETNRTSPGSAQHTNVNRTWLAGPCERSRVHAQKMAEAIRELIGTASEAADELICLGSEAAANSNE